MHQSRCSDEAGGQAFLTSGQSEPQGDVRLAGAGVADRDDVLLVRDVLTARQFQDQHLVESWDHLELKAVEAFDSRELRCLDPPLDHAPFPVNEFKLGKLQKITGMIDPLGGTLPGNLVVLTQERG